jgi:NAD(P)-dependent dehydrogenase (short-subunit alcohol dehydrogenase family)
VDLQLKDKSALVTGSTAGIGLEIARKLAVEGTKVIITGRNKTKLDQAVDSIRSSGGAYVSGVLADAATEEGAAALVRATPNVDILVNNLGIYEMKDFAAITDADWRRYFEVNVLSGARLARAYFPGMLERNWGRIIFISSESGLVTPAEMIHYGMTKTAQLAISRGLAGLTKGTKVTVNSVLPSPTRSEGIIDFLKSLASDPAAPPEQIPSRSPAGHRGPNYSAAAVVTTTSTKAEQASPTCCERRSTSSTATRKPRPKRRPDIPPGRVPEVRRGQLSRLHPTFIDLCTKSRH